MARSMRASQIVLAADVVDQPGPSSGSKNMPLMVKSRRWASSRAEENDDRHRDAGRRCRVPSVRKRGDLDLETAARRCAGRAPR